MPHLTFTPDEWWANSANFGVGWAAGSSLMPPRHPQTQATPSPPPRARRLDLLRVGPDVSWECEELKLARTEGMVAMEPTMSKLKVSAQQPSHAPQPLANRAFGCCVNALKCASRRPWHVFSRAR